ncbi:SigF/SigG family RNA polymerase sporulation sigma factor [Anaerosinus massiliensis]|uniref:SigF/SigG family RNA polymerase sporulation sigma factor n=1 Tax=Massilibacillus massiliensis TaxID=1806837 RepID=UPI000AAA0286|nr:SigF/SigG family RNA polymerase sporulation sigma factor [Massilibacillus massiliensis]
MLDDEELSIFITKAQEGDPTAKEYILKENINLVRSIVHRFLNRGYEWDDLFQIGCIGLIKAIDRFDKNFNVKFSTYAVPMIIGEIRRFMRDDNPIKVSRPLKDIAYKVHKTQEGLQGILGRDPTILEIADKIDLAPQEIVAALEAVQPIVSLYEPTINDRGDQLLLLDQIKSNDSLENENNNLEKIALQEVLKNLPERERNVIILRFYKDKTQAEIAKLIGLSQVQVSRIEKQALKRIRMFL